MYTITDDCDNVLALLQSIAVNSPQVIADPLSLRADKRVHVWFRCWTDVNIPRPTNLAPQDHIGFTGVLTDVATRLHTAEAPHPVVAAQSEVEKDTTELGHLPPTAHHVILAESATNGTSIPTLPPPTIHHLLNARNATAHQADCSLTYTGNNIYLPTSLFQVLLQGHILAIPDPDVPTGLLPLLTPLSSSGPVNAQQWEMIIQVLLSMGQYCLSKEEAGKLMVHRFHVLASTQELRHLTRNIVKLAGGYLGEESPIYLLMGMWPRHIECFERQYNKDFGKDPLFGADFMD